MDGKRKIKLWCFISLDGYTARTNGDMDIIRGNAGLAAYDYGFGAFRDSIGCVVMNSRHYANLSNNELWSVGDKPCHITAREFFPTPPSADIRFILTQDNGNKRIREAIGELALESQGDIWVVGDHNLISLLMKHGMIDEMTVNRLPITLGCGLPLLSPNGSETTWNLDGYRVFDNGVIQCRYRNSGI